MTGPERRGRDVFYRAKSVLLVLEQALSRLPRKARTALLRTVRQGDTVPYRALRYVLLRTLIGCGELVDVRGGVHLLAVDRLRIGDRVSIHPLCYIDATGGISIGNDTSIAHNVTIMSTEHRFDRDDVPIRDQGVTEEPVVISDNVWIGAGSRILAGVTVGAGSVVAAGAVVVKDVPPGVIVGGVPARVIRERGTGE